MRSVTKDAHRAYKARIHAGLGAEHFCRDGLLPFGSVR